MLIAHDILGGAGAVLGSAGSVLAALGVAKASVEWWRRGIGRRRQWIRLFGQVALGVRTAYVIGLFGESAYQRPYEGLRLKTGDGNPCVATDESATFTERVWLLADDGYLQVVSDDVDNVVLYSLTTRTRRFRPRIVIGAAPGNTPVFAVRLGETLFSEIPPPDRVYRGPAGATAPYEYRQSYYYARPGGYADWTCTYNAGGTGQATFLPAAVPVPPWKDALAGRQWLAGLTDEQREHLDHSRSGTVINTVTIEHFLSDRSGQTRYGPDRELVRLLPPRAPSWRKRISSMGQMSTGTRKPADSHSNINV